MATPSYQALRAADDRVGSEADAAVRMEALVLLAKAMSAKGPRLADVLRGQRLGESIQESLHKTREHVDSWWDPEVHLKVPDWLAAMKKKKT